MPTQPEHLRATPRPASPSPGQPASIAHVGVLHPGRDVALVVQHTPDVDMTRALDVEHQIRVRAQRPDAQARQVELVRVRRGAQRRVASDVGVGLLEGVDEAERSLDCILTQVLRDGPVDVPLGLLTRDDWPGFHPAALAALRMRSRRPSK